MALSALLGVLADEGRLELAAELEALLVSQPFVKHTGFYLDLTLEPLARQGDGLAPKLRHAAVERGRARSLNATVRELLAAERGGS